MAKYHTNFVQNVYVLKKNSLASIYFNKIETFCLN